MIHFFRNPRVADLYKQILELSAVELVELNEVLRKGQGDDEAGVREPLRPRSPHPSAAIALEEPTSEGGEQL